MKVSILKLSSGDIFVLKTILDNFMQGMEKEIELVGWDNVNKKNVESIQLLQLKFRNAIEEIEIDNQ